MLVLLKIAVAVVQSMRGRLQPDMRLLRFGSVRRGIYGKLRKIVWVKVRRVAVAVAVGLRRRKTVLDAGSAEHGYRRGSVDVCENII